MAEGTYRARIKDRLDGYRVVYTSRRYSAYRLAHDAAERKLKTMGGGERYTIDVGE